MNLLIVDDHPLVRKGIISILSNAKDINEIKEASNIEEAMSKIKKADIQMSMIDLKLGKESGLDIISKSKELNINMKFIIVTSFLSKDNFAKAEQLAVDGYILKEAFAEDILYAISVISRGKKYYDPEIFRHKEDLNNKNALSQLTNREKEVLKEIGKGLSNEEIANALYISEHTVKKHVSNILSKLDLKHRAQLVFMVNNKLNI